MDALTLPPSLPMPPPTLPKGQSRSHSFPIKTEGLPDSSYEVIHQRPPLTSPPCLPSRRHLAVFWFAPLPGTFVWPPVTVTPFPYCRDIVTHKHHHPECQDSQRASHRNQSWQKGCLVEYRISGEAGDPRLGVLQPAEAPPNHPEIWCY